MAAAALAYHRLAEEPSPRPSSRCGSARVGACGTEQRLFASTPSDPVDPATFFAPLESAEAWQLKGLRDEHAISARATWVRWRGVEVAALAAVQMLCAVAEAVLLWIESSDDRALVRRRRRRRPASPPSLSLARAPSAAHAQPQALTARAPIPTALASTCRLTLRRPPPTPVARARVAAAAQLATSAIVAFSGALGVYSGMRKRRWALHGFFLTQVWALSAVAAQWLRSRQAAARESIFCADRDAATIGGHEAARCAAAGSTTQLGALVVALGVVYASMFFTDLLVEAVQDQTEQADERNTLHFAWLMQKKGLVGIQRFEELIHTKFEELVVMGFLSPRPLARSQPRGGAL